MEIRDGIFVDGHWQPATGNEFLTVINPYTEEPFGKASAATSEDVNIVARSSYRALTEGAWPSTSFDDRVALVRRIMAGVAERSKELSSLSTATMGELAKSPKAPGWISLVDMYIESAERITFEYLRMDRFGDALIRRRPVGVVAAIVPWNAPVRSELKKVIPAILSGCTVIMKPAPETPFGACILAEICTEAGVPPGVVNLVTGGPTTGEALVAHPLVRLVAFTGSSAVGSRIAAIAAQDFTRLELELGGKSAAIVLEDANVPSIAAGLADGIFNNSGQVCTAGSRVLVHKNRYEEVLDSMIDHAQSHILGDPMDPSTTMGPLVAERQRTRVLGYISKGVEEGAKLVTGGDRPHDLPHGWFVEPTVFGEVDNSMTIAQEEIFGPVLSVIRFDNDDEAVRIANDSKYGLGGSVHSGDPGHAFEVAKRVEAGHVGVNQFNRGHSMPFGGVKHSGIHREQGLEGYESFLEYVSHPLTKEFAEELRKTIPLG